MLLTKEKNGMEIIEERESAVRSYSRSFPTVFEKAKDHLVWDVDGKEYIDFFAGAGSLNYGHNNEKMKTKIMDYVMNDGISHSLDMGTVARAEFLETFNEVILRPRNLDYKVMFPGPTGTNTVESALKIARKVTGRQNIISFTNAFHGMTLGSLSISGNSSIRNGAGVPLTNTISMPYDTFFKNGNAIDYLEQYLEDTGSGVDLPAAMILETVQGEGGINAASFEWLRGIEKLCRRYDILLIIDDVQAGCGRTGTFFSFEPAGIQPDIVCLSKSIGGYGLPLAITLIKPEHDIWEPGEHNGTFRGNNMAIVAATEALSYWKTDDLAKSVQKKSKIIKLRFEQIVEDYPELKATTRGRGFMQGIACGKGKEAYATKICAKAFEKGVIMETSGPSGEVVKFLGALTIDETSLIKGLGILEEATEEVVRQ
uniref:Diaminobutyrate--2-oxoglutarate transaminase n=1 Tax=Sporosarcina pasteurii TaxID=1474 RepID=ECTB_SPOPA|nr:RecName: Full=Diaminobutyrate--2-oxoglutarate transaminase; AltName: Full=DABA aminotransferase; AltName: Full=Diaminobutyrate--2-oxoglutarate aminotransferase; AltName: Full=L-2,4-diaminobutyric acid transaminase [Sporosarcina pasteurii]AAK12084.1 EctB [Sporosarcina pasteurii]